MRKDIKTEAEKPKKSMVRIFFKTLLLSLFIFAFIVAAAGFAYFHFAGEAGGAAGAEKTEGIKPGLKKGGGLLADLFDKAPERVNFMLMGVDEAGDHADMIMIGSFVPKTGHISLVSVPRDTKVTLPPGRLADVKTYNSGVPSDGVMKLTEVNHHAGPEHGIEYTVMQVEEVLNVDIDYYVKINLEGLRYFVDAIGGVEFNVPQRMYYNDPTQGLLIDLEPGLQTLDGKDAEGLVRFRYGYARQDLDRVKTQQQFLKAVMKQVLSGENMMTSVPAVLNAGLKYVETNFNMADVPKYLKYLKNFSAESVAAYTLPTSRLIIRGKEFQELDEAGSAAVIQEAFYADAEKTPAAAESSKGKTIQVLNGGYVKGLAGKTQGDLNALGYNVVSVGDYSEEKQPRTRIIVKGEGQGEDLLSVFADAYVEVDPDLSSDYDIVIILGTIEK